MPIFSLLIFVLFFLSLTLTCFVFSIGLRPPVSTHTYSLLPYTSRFPSARRTSRLDAPPDDIARVTGVNINGVLYGCKAAVRQFNAQNGGGVIVNTASVSGLIGWGGAVYNASKRSEEHTSELQSLMRISYAVFCLKKKNK